MWPNENMYSQFRYAEQTTSNLDNNSSLVFPASTPSPSSYNSSSLFFTASTPSRYNNSSLVFPPSTPSPSVSNSSSLVFPPSTPSTSSLNSDDSSSSATRRTWTKSEVLDFLDIYRENMAGFQDPKKKNNGITFQCVSMICVKETR